MANAQTCLTIRFVPSDLAQREVSLRASLQTTPVISCVCGAAFNGPRDRGWLFVIDGNDDPSNTVPSLFGYGWLWTGNATNALCPDDAAAWQIDAVFATDPQEVKAAFAFSEDETETHR